MYASLFDQPDLINQMLGRYLAVTPERIQAVAGEVFRPDNRVVMTYVPSLPPVEGVPEEATPTAHEAIEGVDDVDGDLEPPSEEDAA
jgi:hypothetical protein